MALLLDSPDPQAQPRADWFFGYYTLFADAGGNILGTQVIGPLSSSATRQNMARSKSSLPVAQYTTFWKAWWSQNRASLGF